MRRMRFRAAAWAVLMVSVAAHGALPAHFADATDKIQVTAGKRIYRQRCASCHGRQLQGQPLWQLQDPFERRRAPAHDASGHTWEHSDEALFHMTKYGRFSDSPRGVRSYMPAFAGSLDGSQILAVIAFIKARWPLGLRVSQSLLNPGYAGMPANARSAEWTFPPTCITSAQRWRAVSR